MNKRFSDAAKMARREYARQWRRKNPEKVRESNRRYWERKAQQMQKSGGDNNAKAYMVRHVGALSAWTAWLPLFPVPGGVPFSLAVIII